MGKSRKSQKYPEAALNWVDGSSPTGIGW